MQQRQPRLGDILDDYCPRERRITNHAVVAMIGADVKQTRCTTCDAEHEYKHAKIPRQRRKPETPAALYSQVLADGPKRVAHEPISQDRGDESGGSNGSEPSETVAAHPSRSRPNAGARIESDDEPAGSNSGSTAPEHMIAREGRESGEDTTRAAKPGENIRREGEPGVDVPEEGGPDVDEDGPVHRPLIRATLPRPDGQPPSTRPVPEFTIRQPGSRPSRFRHRHGRGGQQFHSNRSNGNIGGGSMRGGLPRPGGGRPPIMSHLAKGQGHGRKRSK